MLFARFPELRWTFHDALVGGGRAMGFSTWTSAQRGEFKGIPATGRKVGGRDRPLTPWTSRLLFVLLLMVVPGSQLLIYPVLWILMPDQESITYPVPSAPYRTV